MSASAVDEMSISRLTPVISRELRNIAITGGKSPAAALNHIFDELFGRERSEEDRQRFLYLICPVARRVVLGLGDAVDQIGNTGVRVKDLQECMSRLDAHVAARMIDLRYFAGRTLKETAAGATDAARSCRQAAQVYSRLCHRAAQTAFNIVAEYVRPFSRYVRRSLD